MLLTPIPRHRQPIRTTHTVTIVALNSCHHPSHQMNEDQSTPIYANKKHLQCNTDKSTRRSPCCIKQTKFVDPTPPYQSDSPCLLCLLTPMPFASDNAPPMPTPQPCPYPICAVPLSPRKCMPSTHAKNWPLPKCQERYPHPQSPSKSQTLLKPETTPSTPQSRYQLSAQKIPSPTKMTSARPLSLSPISEH